MVVRCSNDISWQADNMHYFEQGKVIPAGKSDSLCKILIKDLDNFRKDTVDSYQGSLQDLDKILEDPEGS